MFRRLYRIYKIIQRKKSRKFITISSVLVILLLVGLFFAQLVLFKINDVGFRANLLNNHPALTKLLPVYWQLRKISDITYLPYIFRTNKVPTYQLIIPVESRKEMDDSLPEGFSNVIYTNKVFAPAKFIFDGKTYDVQVRYRGDNAVHWNAAKKSYLVKFDKDDLFQGIRRLSFIIVDDRLFNFEHFNNYRADKLGLLHPQSSFGSLKINGKNNGLYFMIESWSSEMLAKWEVSDQSNFYDHADPNVDTAVTINYLIWDNLDRWDQAVSDQRFNYDHFTEVFQLVSLLNDSDDQEFYQSIFDLIDKDNFYAWQVHQELVHSNHQTDDVRLLFDNSAGKFFFIPWDLGNTTPSQEIQLYSRLAQRIFSNPVYWHAKDQKLYDYIADKNNLEDDLAFYDKTYDDIKVALYKDRLKIYTNRWADSLVAGRRQDIIDAIDKVKDRFKNNLVFADIGVIDDDSQRFSLSNVLAFIDINTKSYSSLSLKRIEAELIENQVLENYQLFYDSNFNNQLDNNDILVQDYKDIIVYTNRTFDQGMEGGQLELTKHRFYLTSNDLSSSEFSEKLIDIKLNIENAITGKKIKNRNIKIKIVNQRIFKDFDKISDIDKFERENPSFRVNRPTKEIILFSGIYAINNDVIIPKGFTFKISPGTTILMAPGASLVSYSNVVAQGLPTAPINIFGQVPSQPWGVFGVLNSEQESIFENVRLSGGSEAYINGVFMSGMLSVYHSDVKINNSQFSNAAADDSLNIKYGAAEVTNSRFFDNSADAIDFDFVKNGGINNNQFNNNGNDAIDLSGSTILISENNIKNSGDKCISVGEKTIDTVIFNNVLNNCNIGIEIKDLSEIFIINNVIINNQIGLNAYQKKPVFGGGFAEVYNSIIWDNQDDVQTDQQSDIDLFNSNIDRRRQNNNNFNTQPEFLNPLLDDYQVELAEYQSSGDKDILKKYLDLELEQAPVGLIRQ